MVVCWQRRGVGSSFGQYFYFSPPIRFRNVMLWERSGLIEMASSGRRWRSPHHLEVTFLLAAVKSVLGKDKLVVAGWGVGIDGKLVWEAKSSNHRTLPLMVTVSTKLARNLQISCLPLQSVKPLKNIMSHTVTLLDSWSGKLVPYNI